MHVLSYQKCLQEREFPVQEGIVVEAYWRDDRAGRGPAASVYAHDQEVLRLDCFGGDQAHFHVNLTQAAVRWYYPPCTVAENIERAAFDLATNLRFCLRHNRDPEIRALRPDAARMAAVSAEVRAHLLSLLAARGEADALETAAGYPLGPLPAEALAESP